MPLFYAVVGLMLGGVIYLFITIVFEGPMHKRTREKKFGKDSTESLTKEDTQGFYVLSAVISALLGLLIGYLGSQGLLNGVVG